MTPWKAGDHVCAVYAACDPLRLSELTPADKSDPINVHSQTTTTTTAQFFLDDTGS